MILMQTKKNAHWTFIHEHEVQTRLRVRIWWQEYALGKQSGLNSTIEIEDILEIAVCLI